jgi:hypothetical protein
MDVKCRLSCDRCRALGIAPLTSVFIYGQNSDRFQDGISLGSARLGQSAHPCAQRGEGLAAIDLYPYECDPWSSPWTGRRFGKPPGNKRSPRRCCPARASRPTPAPAGRSQPIWRITLRLCPVARRSGQSPADRKKDAAQTPAEAAP